MLVVNKFEEFPDFYKNCVIALGTFDGIHIGHAGIINSAKEYAARHGIKSVVFSFLNHPLDLIAPEKAPSRLCTEAKKKSLLKKLSVDALFNLRFDKNIVLLSSDQFIVDIKRHFSPECIVVGDNYSYGYLGAGTAYTLVRAGQIHGFEVIVHKLVQIDGVVASSTNIRNYLKAGQIAEANKLLGRCYALKGAVRHGDKRGRVLGFPTANLKIDARRQAIPEDGGYLAAVKIGRKKLPAVVNVGTNPTFGNNERRVEAHILDFSQDIYGRQLEIAFIERLRGERIFSSADELIAAIKADIAYARRRWRPDIDF
jgi:riboflavin kinase/FMN adenylyltransferase